MDNNNTPSGKDIKAAMRLYNTSAAFSGLTPEQARAARRGRNRNYMIGLVLTIAGLIATGLLS